MSQQHYDDWHEQVRTIFFVVLAFFFWLIRLIYSSHLYNIYIYLVRLSPTNYTLISSIIHSIDRSVDRSIVFPHLGWLPMCVWVCDCLLHLNQLVTKDENRWTNETRVQRSNYSIPNDAFDVQMYNKWTKVSRFNCLRSIFFLYILFLMGNFRLYKTESSENIV